jgi:hypothetical protein
MAVKVRVCVMSTNDVVIDLEKHEVFSSAIAGLPDSHFPFRRSTASIGGSQAELSRNCAGVGLRRSNGSPMGGVGGVSAAIYAGTCSCVTADANLLIVMCKTL